MKTLRNVLRSNYWSTINDQIIIYLLLFNMMNESSIEGSGHRYNRKRHSYDAIKTSYSVKNAKKSVFLKKDQETHIRKLSRFRIVTLFPISWNKQVTAALTNRVSVEEPFTAMSQGDVDSIR